MIVLQIIMIPLVVMLMLSVVFISGSMDIERQSLPSQSDQYVASIDGLESPQIATPRLPATMSSSKESAKPVTFTTVITMNSDEQQLSALASTLEIETLGKIHCSD